MGKKLLLYLTIIISFGLIITSCGNAKNSNRNTSENTVSNVTKISESEKSTTTGISASENNNESTEITTNKDDEISSATYPIEYKNESDEEKLDKEYISRIAYMAAKQAKAISENDYSTFKQTIKNLDLLKKDISESDLKEAFNEMNKMIKSKSYNITDFENQITKVIVSSCDTEQFKLILFIGNNNGLVFEVYGIYQNDKFLVSVEEIASEADIKTHSELKTLQAANSNAKSLYDEVTEWIADMEVMGESKENLLQEIQGDIDLSNPENVSENKRKLTDAFISEYFDGVVYIGIRENNYYIQWKESYDSELIGQYPNPNSKVNKKYKWGQYN